MPPATFNCTISIAVEVRPTPQIKLCSRVPQDAFAEARAVCAERSMHGCVSSEGWHVQQEIDLPG